MSDSDTSGELREPRSASSELAAESLPEPTVSSEQRASVSSVSITGSAKDAKYGSVKNKGPSLRTKVSKLFGEERNSRASDTSSSSIPSKSVSASYRPISLASQDSNRVSFSGIFDEVYNAAGGSFHSAGASRASADVSTSQLSTSAASPGAVSPIPTAPSAVQGPAAKTEGSRQSLPVEEAKDTMNSMTPREELASQLASRLGVLDPTARAQILAAFNQIAPPPLHEHPAIRGDLALQMDVGLLRGEKTEPSAAGGTTVPATYPNAAATVHVPALEEDGHGPAQVAGANKNKKAPQSKPVASQVPPGFTTRYLVPAHDMAKDLVTPTPVDPYPAFDRTVDSTWYRYTQLLPGHRRRVHQPQLRRIFGPAVAGYISKYARGVENWAKYDQPMYKRRFRYFDLDPSIRFLIMQHLLEGYLPQRFVLLNGKRQAAPAWPPNEFASLWDVLEPLQNYLTTCPRLRADVMVTVFMSQPFHVIFSPFVKPNTQPLPTKWLFNYAQYMQNVRVEVDLTKLGFGPTWESTSMSTKLQEIGNLVWAFAHEMEKRDPDANPMTLLTIYCRRYFGYRQGRNPHQGNYDMYRFPLIGGEEEGHGPKVYKGLPRYYGRPSASLPPSANHPYSKQRLHHTAGPDRVPYLHEGHMSVFHPLRRLQGRVWIVRMVGLSEDWVRHHHSAWWPQEEFDAIPSDIKAKHTDRCMPTDFTYVPYEHAIYVDLGINKGLQRIPALPEKKKRTCTYDIENDVFLENETCNVLTVMENGVEMIARADTRSIPRSELAATGEPEDPIELPDEEAMPPPPPPKTSSEVRNNNIRKASKVLGVAIPDDAHGPVDSAALSSCPKEEAMVVRGNESKVLNDENMDTMVRKKSTSGKASKFLGVTLPKDSPADSSATPPSSSSPEDTEAEDDLVTPIQSRAASTTSTASMAPRQQKRPPVPSRASSNTSSLGGPKQQQQQQHARRQMPFATAATTATEGSDRSEQNSRASSVQGRRPRALSTKKSLMSLLSRDSKKSSKSSKSNKSNK